MISNPKLIFYAGIAKGTTALAEYTSKEDAASNNIQGLALECLLKTPPLHSRFSHTAKKRTYTFLIEDPYVYFAISHEDLPKSEVLWFLNRIKCGFEEMGYGTSMMGNGFAPFCFQSHLDSVFGKALELDLESVNSSRNVENQHQNTKLDSSVNGMMVVPAPLLRQTSKGLKNKKRASVDANGVDGDGKYVAFENKLDVRDESDSFKLTSFGNDRQKARQIWKTHVWVVLLLDLFVCAVLFGIWLWVCRGLKCIDGSDAD